MKKTLYKTDQNHPLIRAYKEAVERGKKSQHVLPQGKNWVVKRAESSNAMKTFSTKREALSVAKTLAANLSSSVFIHDKDGYITSRIDY